MTNSLITVFNGSISNQTVQLANARDLHSFLESNQDFSNWIANRISEYGFVQDEDYITLEIKTRGRPRKEYHITLDMGKELAMVERNEKGRQIRKYFIECERQILQNNQQIAPLAELPSPYINEHEQRQVQEAVNRAVKRTGRDYNNIYHHLKTKFNVAKYTQLKPEQMRDVLIYLAGMPIKQIPSEFDVPMLPTTRLHEMLPIAIFYRDVGKMIKELGAICEELSKSRKSELVAILKNYCDTFSGNAALVRKVRGVLITQLGQLPQDDQDYLRDFIEL